MMPHTSTERQRCAEGDRLRILYAIPSTTFDGPGCWMVELLSKLDTSVFEPTVIATTRDAGGAEDRLRQLCPAVIRRRSRSPAAFPLEVFRLMSGGIAFDVVHSCVNWLNGYVLQIARLCRVPVRIAHSHTAGDRLMFPSMLKRGLAAIGCHATSSSATHLLSVSRAAAVALFGPRSLCDPRLRIEPAGIALEPFRARPAVARVRAELGIPVDAPVIGHVGRFARPKNHHFLVEVAASVIAQRPGVRLLLVGEGPLRGEIEEKVRRLGIAPSVVFAGARPDVPRLMMAAMDVLLFPSEWEGLGRVVVEGQAAGLPCVISDVVPGDVDVVPQLITRLSLSDSPDEWARRVLAVIDRGSAVNRDAALDIVQDSPLNIERSVQGLSALYVEATTLARRGRRGTNRRPR